MPIIWLQLVFLFFALTAHTATFVRTSDHIRYLTTIDEEGDEQVIETTDSHPVWVVTDSPDLSRAAQEVVIENGATLVIDHILPKSKGGTNSFSNAQILSRMENRLKSNKIE